MIEFANFRLDPRAGRLWRGNQPVDLRPKAWALLSYLLERPGVLVTKDEMHAAVWGDTVVSDDTLSRTLAELRQALRDSARKPRVIETVHRRGVRLIATLSEAAAPPERGGRATGGAGAEPIRPPLVGRHGEIARLLELYRQASAFQRQTVFVQGEAGIGKSSLVAAFLDRVRASPDGVLVGHGQCVEQYGEREPYMPVLEALERLTRGPAGERVVPLLRSIAPSWLAQMPTLLRPVDEARLRERHTDLTPHRMLREFASLAEAISETHPLVLVIDDLHWSDQGTVDVVSVLAQRTDRARLLLVGTCRPAQAAALDHPIQRVLTLLRARDRCVDMALEYLSRKEVAAYLEQRFGGARVAGEIVKAVHARTDGNPLFMVMLVDDLLARGWLAEDRGVWRLTVPPGAVEQDVPDNLRAMIVGQLRFTAPEELDVLEAASVAGVAFDAPAVAAGLDRSTDRVESICHRLSDARRWLHYQGNRQWPDRVLAARYSFQHALFQQALYDRLSPTRRATLHERIGLRQEKGYAGRTVEASRELARHFQASHDHRRALIYLDQAATRARDRGAYKDVIACLEPALLLLRELPETPTRARDELRLRRLHSAAMALTGGYAADALLESLTRIRELCVKLGDRAALFDTLAGLVMLHASSDLARAAEIGADLQRIGEGLDASADLQCRFLRGSIALYRGDLADAESFLASALASTVSPERTHRPYGIDPFVGARSHEALRRWLVGDPPGARAVQQEALARAEQSGEPFALAQALAFSARLSALDADWVEAETLATRAADLADSHGFPMAQGAALVVRGRALVARTGGLEGLAEMREGLAHLHQAGFHLGRSQRLALLAEACLEVDRVDEGLATVDTGLQHCRDTGERFFEAELWRIKGELLLRRGPTRSRSPAANREADECFATAHAVADGLGARALALRARRRSDAAPVARRARRP